MQRCNVRYQGRVQGVSFRATSRAIAARFRVTGWVQNEPDGSVQLEVQGLETEVTAFLSALRGELGGFIRGSEVCPVAALPEETGFDIRR